MINIEQTRWDACLYVEPFFYGKRDDPMFTSHCKKGTDAHIVALVELDMQKMQVHIVLSREAIRERLQELEYPLGTTTGTSGRVGRVEGLRNCE